MMPERDMQEIIGFWVEFLKGAKALGSTFLLNDARSLYNDMTKAFPGEKDIAELRPHVPRRTKKASDV
jgi:hypothetical protein